MEPEQEEPSDTPARGLPQGQGGWQDGAVLTQPRPCLHTLFSLEVCSDPCLVPGLRICLSWAAALGLSSPLGMGHGLLCPGRLAAHRG